MNATHKKISMNKRSALYRPVLLMLFVAWLGIATPAPAHANLMFDIPTTVATVFGWAMKIVNMIADEVEDLYEQAVDAIRAAIPITLEQITTNVEVTLAQAKADGGANAVKAKNAGDTAAKATISTASPSCAITHGAQEASVADVVTRAQVAALTGMSASRGTGPKGDTSSPAYAAVEAYDLCKIGFLDTSGAGRYGNLPRKMGCTTPLNPRFIDADMRLSSVIGTLQYPMPQPSHVDANTPDGHINFAGVTATETAPGLGSEMDYAAAYKFCEHLQPVLPTPTHSSGTPTQGDIASMNAFARASALRTGAAAECFQALAYRTSCRQAAEGSMTAADGSGASCHEAQNQLCARLTSLHADGGLELTMDGANPVFAAALTACKDNGEGISQAMYDAIISHRCQDAHYAFQVLPAIMGKGPALERVRAFDCPSIESSYDFKMGMEREKLETAIESLILMSNGQNTKTETPRVAQ